MGTRIIGKHLKINLSRITDPEIFAHYLKIKKETTEIISNELGRIINSPELVGKFLVQVSN